MLPVLGGVGVVDVLNEVHSELINKPQAAVNTPAHYTCSSDLFIFYLSHMSWPLCRALYESLNFKHGEIDW